MTFVNPSESLRILIQADYGNVWACDPEDGSVSDLQSLFPDIPALVQLDLECERWTSLFDLWTAATEYDRRDFPMDWTWYNDCGRDLAVRLKAIVGDRATVFYRPVPRRPDIEAEKIDRF